MTRRAITALCAIALTPAATRSQVDQARATTYFKEAAALCEREGGRLWGVLLCGPMVIADPVTHTIATNQTAPNVRQPAVLGFANAALDWGGTRWSTFVWATMPTDEYLRGRLMIHELFHRVQPQLGLLGNDGQNEHLDTPEGRYWLQLEWRALARALGASGRSRDSAVADAFAFRAARRRRFADAAENERRLEINEGLAQYTGTVAASDSPAAARADAIDQLTMAPQINPTLVRTFPYPSGAAYGLLLDAWSPGWPRRIKSTDDIGEMVRAAARIEPTENADAAAERYGGAALKVAEDKREADRIVRVTELRRRFVDGPVIVVPTGKTNAYITTGITPIPGAGAIYPSFRTTADWGSLEAAQVLMSPDRQTLILPAPARVDGTTIRGDGWTLTLAAKWVVRAGARSGDYRVVADSSR